ncbi:PREDICTED: uncharacterized protein LOC105853280 [Condylura cristata]|uniref:uncharacterized protein LOC105853280 n=1 Tax=Condylura cristata TaxID=143302 RepID=UPI000642C7ED|nr:PREDICTED: uncharacterized protein LOC105853280 [Condylura cristata]
MALKDEFRHRTHGLIPPPPSAHKSLASKIFCLCCRDCREPQDMDDSSSSSQTQEHQTLTGMELSLPGLQLQKNELGRQNPKHTNPGKPLIHPEEDTFSSSFEFETRPLVPVQATPHPALSLLSALRASNSERRFYKRNLNRYSQERWPYQRCLIGKP